MNIPEVMIVKYGLPAIEKDCIASVTKGTNIDYRLTIIDNYKKQLPLTQVWNEFAREIKTKWICLLNADTIVPKFWLERMLATADSDDEIAALGPMTNKAPTEQSKLKFYNGEVSFNAISKFSDHLWESYGPKFYEGEITGFCYLIRTSALYAADYFDESYPFYGQETVMNVKLRDLGFKVGYTQGVFVYHIGAAYTSVAEKQGRNMANEKNEAMERFIGSQKRSFK